MLVCSQGAKHDVPGLHEEEGDLFTNHALTPLDQELREESGCMGTWLRSRGEEPASSTYSARIDGVR